MKIELNLQVAEAVQHQIERAMRLRIQNGELAPQQRIPSTNELVRQWHVGRGAVQRAMATLADEGWIERKPMRGTFVKSPTQPSCIGVLFRAALAEENAHFQRAVFHGISTEISKLTDSSWTCRAYDGLSDLDSSQDFARSRAFQHLANDLKNYPFAGFIQILGRLASAKVATMTKDLPVARFGPPSDPLTDVTLDYAGFGRASVERMAGSGRRKLVYFRAMDDMTSGGLDVQGIEQAARELKLPPVRMIQLRYESRSGPIEQAAYEQMLAAIEDWTKHGLCPQGLIVSDDGVMRGVAMALVRKGITVEPINDSPKTDSANLAVMAMTNEGINYWYGIPVFRQEFSPGQIACELLRALQGRIQKKKPPVLPVKIACAPR
ncbi:MAG: GntR family transcriptional regulator [Verrucomicrobiae bacterium]|nr:GntR family transcriptional regulator [Verrucomicrobiae bacterium]